MVDACGVDGNKRESVGLLLAIHGAIDDGIGCAMHVCDYTPFLFGMMRVNCMGTVTCEATSYVLAPIDERDT